MKSSVSYPTTNYVRKETEETIVSDVLSCWFHFSFPVSRTLITQNKLKMYSYINLFRFIIQLYY